MRRQTLLSVQYLRGIAALMVAYFHLAIQSKEFALPHADHFSGGVDIFFAISGFIMVATSTRLSTVNFMARRLVRIVPLYWILLLAVFALGAVDTLHHQPLHHSFTELWKSLAFVPYRGPTGELLPIIGPGWSLNIEMYFYVLFAVTLLPAMRRYQLLILGVLFAVLVTIQARTALNPIAAFYMQPRLLEFWAGMAIGNMYVCGWLKMPRWIAFSGLIGASAALLLPIGAPLIFTSVAALAGIVCLEDTGSLPSSKALTKLGDASYSIYLTHVLTINLVYLLMRRWHLGAGWATSAVFAVIAAVAIVGIGLLSYRYIEQPLLRILKRWTHVQANSAGVTNLSAAEIQT